jgi:hypothetical protein
VINETTRNKFKEDINTADWDNVIKENDSQTSYTQFHSQLSAIFEKHFPLKKIKIGYKNRLPWVTLAIKK